MKRGENGRRRELSDGEDEAVIEKKKSCGRERR